jgi:hypothetical protein
MTAGEPPSPSIARQEAPAELLARLDTLSEAEVDALLRDAERPDDRS